jgi:tRNA pseudouridine38-40 synthase
MNRYFIQLAYDGTAYHGWQRQPNALTVQEVVENALTQYTGQPVFLTGQGRTDTGVHASEFYAHWDSSENIDSVLRGPVEEGVRTLNRMLPGDIVIHRFWQVSPEMHARYSALFRTYRYRIHWSKDPFRARYSWQVPSGPDWDSVFKATALLAGNRDYGCFAKSGGGQHHEICNLTHAEWTINEGQSAVFEVRANRFLRNMVRAIVGTLMEVGRGYRSCNQVEDLLNGGTRSEAGSSAPAHGLCLTRVEYPAGSIQTAS